jgi:hypothetical protein
MGSGNYKIAERFVAEAGKPDAQLLRGQSGNVLVSRFDERALCSYGTHFTLARIMLDAEGKRAWWLLNGDTFSSSTTQHQSMIRGLCKSSGLPSLIIPFSCLSQANIELDSIVPIDIREDRWENISHTADRIEDVPKIHLYCTQQREDGKYVWNTFQHRLGASLFRATYRSVWRRIDRTAYFLSAFDEQESRVHYFLCELPESATPSTVAEAIDALKPEDVKLAEQDGLTCTRQGDVFAIPTTLTTRELTRQAATRTRNSDVLGLSHTATEVAVHAGTTYARGILRHAPPFGRQPEHARRSIGNRKTWHRLVKNTVPVDDNGDSRAWSRGGRVD